MASKKPRKKVSKAKKVVKRKKAVKKAIVEPVVEVATVSEPVVEPCDKSNCCKEKASCWSRFWTWLIGG